jgi:uncharacterized membrane protein YgaE (UPF0421/DUF939 family)
MSPASTSALQLGARSAIAAAVSVAIAQWFDPRYALYALICSVLVTDVDPAKTRRLALKRLGGSVLGATVGALFSTFLPSTPWAIGIGVGIAILVSHLLRFKGASNITGYVCGLVILSHGGEPLKYALGRVAGTLLGILVAVTASFIPNLLHVQSEPEC